MIWIDRVRRRSISAPDPATLDELEASLGTQFRLRVARALRSKLVVFVEGKDMRLLRRLASTVGADHFVTKLMWQSCRFAGSTTGIGLNPSFGSPTTSSNDQSAFAQSSIGTTDQIPPAAASFGGSRTLGFRRMCGARRSLKAISSCRRRWLLPVRSRRVVDRSRARRISGAVLRTRSSRASPTSVNGWLSTTIAFKRCRKLRPSSMPPGSPTTNAWQCLRRRKS